jgi:hypothetical protein
MNDEKPDFPPSNLLSRSPMCGNSIRNEVGTSSLSETVSENSMKKCWDPAETVDNNQECNVEFNLIYSCIWFCFVLSRCLSWIPRVLLI